VTADGMVIRRDFFLISFRESRRALLLNNSGSARSKHHAGGALGIEQAENSRAREQCADAERDASAYCRKPLSFL